MPRPFLFTNKLGHIIVNVESIDVVTQNRLQNDKSIIRASASLAGKIFPWIDVIAEVWRFGRILWERTTNVGIYEVLEYNASLKICDVEGKRAQHKKHQKVRFLQNNVIAYEDQAWGDGNILLNYKCSPGVAADQYKPDRKTFILISLRDAKQRGEIEDFHIQWEMDEAFTNDNEFWSTDISHRTKQLRLEVSFPIARPPVNARGIIRRGHVDETIELNELEKGLDGSWTIVWEVTKPKLGASYLINWQW